MVGAYVFLIDLYFWNRKKKLKRKVSCLYTLDIEKKFEIFKFGFQVSIKGIKWRNVIFG